MVLSPVRFCSWQREILTILTGFHSPDVFFFFPVTVKQMPWAIRSSNLDNVLSLKGSKHTGRWLIYDVVKNTLCIYLVLEYDAAVTSREDDIKITFGPLCYCYCYSKIILTIIHNMAIKRKKSPPIQAHLHIHYIVFFLIKILLSWRQTQWPGVQMSQTDVFLAKLAPRRKWWVLLSQHVNQASATPRSEDVSSDYESVLNLNPMSHMVKTFQHTLLHIRLNLILKIMYSTFLTLNNNYNIE